VTEIVIIDGRNMRRDDPCHHAAVLRRRVEIHIGHQFDRPLIGCALRCGDDLHAAVWAWARAVDVGCRLIPEAVPPCQRGYLAGRVRLVSDPDVPAGGVPGGRVRPPGPGPAGRGQASQCGPSQPSFARYTKQMTTKAKEFLVMGISAWPETTPGTGIMLHGQGKTPCLPCPCSITIR